MQGLMIFTNGFEDVEGLATKDVLNRAHINLKCVSLHDDKKVVTSNNTTVLFDASLNEVNYENYDFLIIPGGPAVFKELFNTPLIDKIVTYFAEHKKLICTICAAPALVGKHGYFNGLKYTCFPGCDKPITSGTNTHESVVVEDLFITARSMYYSCDFALAIIEKLLGKETRNQIESQIQGRY